MGEAIAAISTALEVVRKIQGIESAMQNADLRGLVLDLREELLIVRERSVSLAEENADLRRQLAEALSPSLALRDGLYFDGEDGPYCTACYDVRGNRVRVTGTPPAIARTIGRHMCPDCKSVYP